MSDSGQPLRIYGRRRQSDRHAQQRFEFNVSQKPFPRQAGTNNQHSSRNSRQVRQGKRLRRQSRERRVLTTKRKVPVMESRTGKQKYLLIISPDLLFASSS